MEETPRKSPPRWIWWAVGGAVGCVLIGAAVWFMAGHRVWTDGGTIRVAERDARLREVLWSKPLDVEGFSSEEQAYEPSISPDGTELYFVRGKAGKNAKIFVSYRHNNHWSAPVPVDAVDGPFDSLGPRLTTDGSSLLFYSDRPGGLGGYDIWAAPRTPTGWGKPYNLGPSVNSEFNEFNPDPTPDGRRLIFSTNRKSARRAQKEAWRSTIRETVSSDYDLWIADADPASFVPDQPTTAPSTQLATTQASTQPVEAPVQLAYRAAHEIPGINTEFSEGASCMSPAGDFLYFSSDRPGGAGKFDIYRCRVRGEQFGPVENLGQPINTPENEADPALACNGFRMFFSSDRPGADGRYHLLASDSREVYPERQSHPLPQLGWSWWLLILSVLVLVPLLMFLRGWEDHRLGLFQKCLLLSLLVHALITFILSFVVVTQKLTQYVKHETQMEVAVQLNQDVGVEESIAIRSQVSGNLPTSAAPAINVQPARVTSDAPSEAVSAPVDVPGVRAAPGGMTIAAQSPRLAPAPAQRQEMPRVQAAAVSTTPDAIELTPPTVRRLAQTEAAPQVAAAQPQVANLNPVAPPSPAPAAINIGASPSARPSSESMADAAAPKHAIVAPPPQGVQVQNPVPATAMNAPPTAGPTATGPKVSAAEQAIGPAGGAVASAVRSPAPDASQAVAPAAPKLSGSVPGIAPAAQTIADPGLAARLPAASVVTHPGDGPRASDALASTPGPQVHIAANSNRQSAPEATPGANLANAPGQSAVQPAHDPAMAGIKPGHIDVSSGLAKSSPASSDLASAPVSTSVAEKLAPATGTGAAPSAQTGAAPLPPQVASSLPGGSTRLAQAVEHALAPSARGGDPTTRPVQLAASDAADGPGPVGVRPGAVQPATPRQTSDLAPGIRGARTAAPTVRSAEVRPHIGSPEGQPDALQTTPLAVGAKLAAKSDEVRPTEGAGPGVLTAATKSNAAPAGGAPRVMLNGPLPAATAGNQSLVTGPVGASPVVEVPGIKSIAAVAQVGDASGPDMPSPHITQAGHATVAASEKMLGGDAANATAQPASSSASAAAPAAVDLHPAPMVGAIKSPAGDNKNDTGPGQAPLSRTAVASAGPIIPDVTLDPLGGPLGPGRLTAPDSPFMRSPAQRKPLLEKLGGTRQSEDAVGRGLAYLARVQEEDGRWTQIDGDPTPGKHPKHAHDMACTAFAVLAYLGQDHRPDKPGPYREVVARAVDYLISQQDPDGDLRGPHDLRGGGSDSGNMYDQGIAAYALSECGIMTHDPRIIEAATKGARFIVKAQDPGSGGWRYSPGESGDSSVFGWQVMALHSAEQIGFTAPPTTLENAKKYVKSCEEGNHHSLGGYQPHTGPTPPMTAELLFCRMLLGVDLSDDAMKEATTFLANDPPTAGNVDLYYWYYASLSMLNMQNPQWKDWNVRTREALISIQRRDGPSAGSWETGMKWGSRGGRVFTTAMATLTLEVYYRYLPLRKNAEAAEINH